MYTIRKSAPASHSRRRKLLWIVGGFVLLLIIIVAVLELTNTTGWFHTKPNKDFVTQTNTPGRSVNSNTKGENDASDAKQDTTNTSNTPPTNGEDNKQNTTAPGITGELLTPSGSFVGNHRPANGGIAIQSVCNTSPGAACQIIFKKGSETKSLPVQTTDRGGAAYWTWTADQIGLSAGNWSIQATATAGGQTKTATDSIALEVK
jgi:hypothetical protein